MAYSTSTPISVNSTTFSVNLPLLSLFSNMFRAYADPVLCLMALFGNIGVLTAMARVTEKSFNRSVRFYYSLLAIDELLMVGGCVFAIDFLEIGISYLTGNFRILTIDGAFWSCKFLITVWEGLYCADGFILVCIGIERLIAITWPLRAKTILSLRFSALLTVCVVGGVLVVFLPQTLLVYTLTTVGCTYDLSVFIVYEYITLENILPVIHSLFSFSITMYLIVTLVRSKRVQKSLVKGAGAAISAREISNVLTLLALDVSHLVIFIPYACLACYWLISMALEGTLVIQIYSTLDIFYAVRPVPFSLTFFIHFFRSADFRVALFGKRFRF